MGINQGRRGTGNTSPQRSAQASRSDVEPAEPAQIGRFEVLEALGRGSRGAVFLARDPGRGNKVAIKTLGAGWPAGTELPREAQALSQLQHPHLVGVLEVCEYQGTHCLVYQYVPGQSLKGHLRDQGPLQARKAARWMIQILDAVAYAHEQGIVHLDLRPTSIQIDRDGVLRVMDFGVSVLTSGPTAVGDPLDSANYLAPELLHGTEAGPAGDIFSLGLILHEMVTGSPAVSGNDPVATMQWIAHNTIAPPSSRRAELDREFDQIVQKALEKNPKDRYANAREMQRALGAFLEGTSPKERPVDDASALSFLLRRMRRRADFPAISQNMSLVGRKTASDSESSVDELANIILKDYALTTKLLRLVNSSYYGQYGGQISTVSRAVVVLGLTQVRNAALSLLLFEHLGDKPQAYELREVAGRAFLSGNIGGRIAAALRIPDPERAFVCAMLHTLGRYLIIFYFPEEHEEILSAVKNTGLGEAAASREILGLSPEELAVGVARDWHLPDEIIQSMRPLPDKALGKPAGDEETLHYIAVFANKLADIIVRPSQAPELDELSKLQERFKAFISLAAQDLSAIVESALDDLSAHAGVFNLNLSTSRFYRNAKNWAKSGKSRASASPPETAEQDSGESDLPAAPARDPSSPEAILLNGMQDITQAILSNYALNDILVMVLETLFRGLGFSRVLLCIRDAKHARMAARFGLGKHVDRLIGRFHFPITPGPDIFSRALQEQDDLVCNAPGTSEAVPDWHRALVKPGAFALCPVVVNGVTLGLIYADREEADKAITRVDLNYLDALRNQAALAVKQRS